MSNKPNYYAFSVKDRGRRQSAIWTRIGAVWAQERGQGLDIELEALPLNFDGKYRPDAAEVRTHRPPPTPSRTRWLM